MARKEIVLKSQSNKTKIVRPSKSKFLGFTFWKGGPKWKCKPSNEAKAKLFNKVKAILRRRYAVARPLSETFTEINQVVRGWINYYKIGSMKNFIDTFGQWLRHKIRVIIIKQWKKPKRIYTNLQRLNRICKCDFKEDIYKVANSRLGWYRKCGMDVVNYLLSPKVLSIKKADRPGLVNPLEYYLS